MTARVAGAVEGRPSNATLSESLERVRYTNAGLRDEMHARRRELLEDVAFMAPRAALLASVAHHIGPEFHQAAWAIEHRLGRMARRAGFVL